MSQFRRDWDALWQMVDHLADGKHALAPKSLPLKQHSRMLSYSAKDIRSDRFPPGQEGCQLPTEDSRRLAWGESAGRAQPVEIV